MTPASSTLEADFNHARLDNQIDVLESMQDGPDESVTSEAIKASIIPKTGSTGLSAGLTSTLDEPGPTVAASSSSREKTSEAAINALNIPDVSTKAQTDDLEESSLDQAIINQQV